MTVFKWFLIALAGYGALTLLMVVMQRSLMYLPQTVRTAPQAARLPAANEMTLDTADGERVIVWHIPPRPGKPVVLYLHGNGGALTHRVPRFQAIASRGLGLVALSYRGFGGSTGKPTEAGLIEDARAAYDFAAPLYSPEQIVVIGESLGAGVAVALAAERPVARVVLQSPFTSALHVARARYWFLPVRLLMGDQFRTDRRITGVTAPMVIVHGERDDVVPFTHGEKLFAMVQGPKAFVRLPTANHNDLDEHGAFERIVDFVETGALPKP